MDKNQALFETLYTSCASEVKRFIFTVARRDPEAASDIFQNTWINVWRYLDSLRDVDSAKAWVYSIAKNEAKRYYSSVDPAQIAAPLFAEDDAGAFGESLPDEKESSFPEALCDADRLRILLDELEPGEQQLILLHYYYGMALTEIADTGGLNYNTVKSQFRRTLAKLRNLAERQRD